MEKFKEYMAKYSSLLTIILGIVAIIASCFAVYGCMHPAQTVTQESQQEAETPQGIQEAAQAAKVSINGTQAAEAVYGYYEDRRGGDHAFYDRTMAKMPEFVEQAMTLVRKALP